MTLAEARAYLQISKNNMAKLLREKVLVTRRDVLDRRIRVVLRADVEALAARSVKNAA
jgi:hypothetical protein